MLHYATLEEADCYFESRLHTDLWDASLVSDRRKAMAMATRMIDTLNYTGEKTAAHIARLLLDAQSCGVFHRVNEATINAAGSTQPLEFPRGGDTVVPEDIKIACFEIAYALLDGRDPDQDLENLVVSSRGFSSVRSANDRSFLQEHTQAGIPSATAWRYLRRYLRDTSNLTISRVD